MFRSITELEEAILSCKKCDLHEYRRNPVVGEGPIPSKLMIVGEAPGKYEDLEGRPFVGPAGKLLNEALQRAGVNRSDVYITNVVKCRPPHNRDPTEDEINACKPYLVTQISLVNPRLILCLGRIAGRVLFTHFKLPWSSISKERGKVRKVNGMLIIATYHPAAVLRRKKLREIFFSDVLRAVRLAFGKSIDEFIS